MKDLLERRRNRGITMDRGRNPTPWVQAALALIRAGSRTMPPPLPVDSRTYLFPSPRRIQAGPVTLGLLQWPSDGPTLLLVHGLNANAWIWARTACLLSPERNVLAMDQRGHGRSDVPPAGHYSLAHTSTDLEQLLDALDLDQVDLAGHSWGGLVVAHFAATRPERVRSLILADPVLPQGLNRIYRALDAVLDALFAAERGPFPDEASWWNAYHLIEFLFRDDPMDRRFWKENFVRRPDGSFHHRLPDDAFEEILYRTLMSDVRAQVRGIRCPVLLMKATATINFLPGELWWTRRHLFPREVTIAGSHSFIHANPVDSARAMRAFLHETSPVRRR